MLPSPGKHAVLCNGPAMSGERIMYEPGNQADGSRDVYGSELEIALLSSVLSHKFVHSSSNYRAGVEAKKKLKKQDLTNQ